MDKRHTHRLDAIYDEVKKTNGRVRELEKWRSWLTGAVALSVALGLDNIVKIVSGGVWKSFTPPTS